MASDLGDEESLIRRHSHSTGRRQIGTRHVSLIRRATNDGSMLQGLPWFDLRLRAFGPFPLL